MLATIVDFFVDSSPVARDEDILAEQRIIEQKIEEAINEVEKKMKRTLSAKERAEVREIILIQMETEPSAG